MTICASTPRGSALDARREELLTVKEYAYLMRLHIKSVYRRIDGGRQPGVVRIGREIRIDISSASAETTVGM